MSADEIRDASDAMLVVAVGRYRQEALAEAYRRHAGAVFALSRRLLIDRNLAEEVVQEVFLRLWHRPEKFDPDRGSLRSFLLAQTHGRSVDILRSEVSRRQREERDARATAESDYDIEHAVVDMAVADEVREAMSSSRPASGRPSSSPTSAVIPTGRWPSSSTSRRARSRAASVRASAACGRSSSRPGSVPNERQLHPPRHP